MPNPADGSGAAQDATIDTTITPERHRQLLAGALEYHQRRLVEIQGLVDDAQSALDNFDKEPE